ncbi:MAG: PrsW family glutamic-type intramembrane protease, partial [Pirellulaceae bacterium]|nr:PrsW family glutamic-type intramembrane protease [Pirellulaceae bacterium]
TGALGVLDPVQRVRTALNRNRPDDAVEMLQRAVSDQQAPFDETLQLIGALGNDLVPFTTRGFIPGLSEREQLDPQGVEAILESGRLGDEKQRIAIALWSSVRDETSEFLDQLLAEDPSRRYVRFALGVYYETKGSIAQAAAAFEAEGEHRDGAAARSRAVKLYVAADDSTALKRLSGNPLYRGLIPPRALLSIAEHDRDWLTYWWTIPLFIWEQWRLGPVLLAGFAGLCWGAFAFQAGQVYDEPGARWWLCLAAIVAGALSVWPTLMFIVLQESYMGLEDSIEPVRGIIYNIFGIGLREEFAKLLLFLPLAAFIARRRNQLEALVVGSLVGLGFAAEENIGYFQMGAMVAVGRYLMANFFHMAATGLVALAFMRAVWEPRRDANMAVAMFALVVTAHGLYDAAITLPFFGDFGQLVNGAVFVLLAVQYFRELRSVRTWRSETISLPANFLCGVSLVTAVALVYTCASLGPALGFRIFIPPALAISILCYVFLKEMPGSLVS